MDRRSSATFVWVGTEETARAAAKAAWAWGSAWSHCPVWSRASAIRLCVMARAL